MTLALDDVKRIAHLARIEVSDAEAEGYLGQLSGILGLMEEMAAVDVAGIEPMAHAQEVSQRLRPDVVSEPDQREAFLALAPQAEAGLYLVPKVIE
jgi:aspartyl-tRNA(Asn)/glutamyl-tRNA(Gln) amidotransferase subunit C